MLLRKAGLHTVCESARCPNMAECFSRPTATFMILGDHCTRSCRFCGVTQGKPDRPDPGEAQRVAKAAQTLGLKYTVVTSVTRDDLPDRGAQAFVEVIRELRDKLPGSGVEVLIPDFMGENKSIDQVVDAGPDVFGHNIETVPRLYSTARPEADYRRSLDVIHRARELGSITKSGIMVGLGETYDEIFQVMDDLLDAGCRVLTIGQYLQPSRSCLPVERYLELEEYDVLKKEAGKRGFAEVFSGPLVRSSYLADQVIKGVSD